MLQNISLFFDTAKQPTFTTIVNQSTSPTTDAPPSHQIQEIIQALLDCRKDISASQAKNCLLRRVDQDWKWTVLVKFLLIYHHLLTSESTTQSWLANFLIEFQTERRFEAFRDKEESGEGFPRTCFVRDYAAYLKNLASHLSRSEASQRNPLGIRRASASSKEAYSYYKKVDSEILNLSRLGVKVACYFQLETAELVADRDDEELHEDYSMLVKLLKSASRIFTYWQPCRRSESSIITAAPRDICHFIPNCPLLLAAFKALYEDLKIWIHGTALILSTLINRAYTSYDLLNVFNEYLKFVQLCRKMRLLSVVAGDNKLTKAIIPPLLPTQKFKEFSTKVREISRDENLHIPSLAADVERSCSSDSGEDSFDKIKRRKHKSHRRSKKKSGRRRKSSSSSSGNSSAERSGSESSVGGRVIDLVSL